MEISSWLIIAGIIGLIAGIVIISLINKNKSLSLLIDAKKEVTIMGDNSLSRRDFSRVTEPLTFFGVNIISKKKNYQ